MGIGEIGKVAMTAGECAARGRKRSAKTCFLRANLGLEGSSCGCVPGVRPVHHFSGGVICAGSIGWQAVEGSYGQQHGGQQREQDPLVLFISSGSDGDFQADPNDQ